MIALPTSSESECHRAFELIEERLGQPIPADWLSQLGEAVQDALAAELEPVAGIVEALAAIPHRMCVASSTGHGQESSSGFAIPGCMSSSRGTSTRGRMSSMANRHRDLFLAAAASEQADPARCVVVEDGPAGVQAAAAAGMPVLAYAA